MRYILGIIKALCIAALVLFCVFNIAPLDIVVIKGYLVYTVPAFLPILVAAGVGALLTSMFFIKEKLVVNKEIKKLKNQLTQAEADIKRLQNLPLVQNADETSEKSEVE